jgi:hypothetical protein
LPLVMSQNRTAPKFSEPPRLVLRIIQGSTCSGKCDGGVIAAT